MTSPEEDAFQALVTWMKTNYPDHDVVLVLHDCDCEDTIVLSQSAAIKNMDIKRKIHILTMAARCVTNPDYSGTASVRGN